MKKYLALAGSVLLLVVAGVFAWRGIAQDAGEDPIPPAPARAEAATGSQRPATPPSADERTKEQRRFDRADRDENGRITLAELYEPRRKAYDRLDTNRDGRLSFEEWAVRTSTKFGEADRNRDGQLDRTEYARTAPTPRPAARRQDCAC